MGTKNKEGRVANHSAFFVCLFAKVFQSQRIILLLISSKFLLQFSVEIDVPASSRYGGSRTIF
jgi:hypothetical protein